MALVALLSALVAFALYAPSLSFEFVNWDDWEYVLFNPHLGENGLDFARWCLTIYQANWHPATLFSYGLDHALWERDAIGYHLTNVLLHAANSALVVWLAWLLLRRVDERASASLFGAGITGLVFACHPLHVESVAWISERKDVLYAFFWLASLIAWLAYADPEADRRGRRRAYALALAAYVVSALAKPMAVTLPLILLILDVYPLRRLARRRDWPSVAILEKLPFFAISIAVGVLTLFAQSERGALGKAGLSLGERVWVAVRALGFYLSKWIAPVGLVPLYPLEQEIDPLRWPYWTALLALSGLVAAAFVYRRRVPWIAWGLAFYVVTLLPVLGLIEVGYQSAADRYMYVPMLGPLIPAGALGAAAWRRSTRTRRIAVAISSVSLVWLGWQTSDQAFVWRDSTSLWRHVVSAYPGSAIAHYNLGHAHYMAGRPLRAEAEWRRTLEIDAAYVPALYELGAAAARKREYGEARRYLEAVIAVDPSHARARLDLAMVLEELGLWSEAARHYREFIRRAPPAYADQIEFAQSRLAERATER